MRRALVVLLVFATSGCLSALDAAESPTGRDCADAGDGGACDEPPLEADFLDGGDENPQASVRDDACPLLVARVCGGEEDGCPDAPACIAAQVLDEADDVDRCQAAYDNKASWPDCVPGPCTVLVQRVCGALASPASCEEAPGCSPARDLLAGAESDDAEERQSAETSCNAALEDDVVFSTCG